MFGRRRYEDDYEELDDNAIGGTFVPPQQLTWVDYLIAGVLGTFAALFSYLLSYRGLQPEAWADCAVAAGIRPAELIAPGYWRILAKGLFGLFGISGGMTALVVFGKVFLGAIVALGYLTFKEVLAILVRMIDKDNIWCRVLSRGACVLMAVLFLCSDPVWRLGMSFTPTLLEAFFFAMTVFFLSRFLAGGSVTPAYIAMFLLGLLGAETPLGLIALIGFWLIFYILLTKGGLFHVQLLQPLLQQSSKWYLTFFWAVGIVLGAAVNVISFMKFGGMAQTGQTVGHLPIFYASQIWHAFTGAASSGAWIIGTGVVLLPFILGVAMLRRATDVEYFLHYHVGIVFFIIGCLAYSQMASLYPLWFWNLNKAIDVRSPLLLFLCAQMIAVALLCAMSVVLVDAFCRDHRRLAAQYDPDLDEQLPQKASGRPVFRIGICVFVSLILLAGAIPGRCQPKTKQMLQLIDDYVAEVVAESEGCDFLFTDGSFDCGIELESRRRGGNLFCLSAQGAQMGARHGYAMTSLMTDDEDRVSAQFGGANILRTWQGGVVGGAGPKSNRLERCGLQVGLELWRQLNVKLEHPRVSGVIARTVWPDEAAFDEGTDRGYALSTRLHELAVSKGGFSPLAGKMANELIHFMQWRFARLAQVRSELLDHAATRLRGEEKPGHEKLLMLAAFNRNITETLDGENHSLSILQEAMRRAREHQLSQMTPREGLYINLHLRNFPMARRFAELVLDADPDEPQANFAVGMAYFMQEQYALAEEFLLRCTKRNAREPAIWNNLAVLQYRQGRYEEALVNAQKACQLAPENLEVQDTLRKIEACFAEAQ